MSAGDAYTFVNGNVNYCIGTNSTVRFKIDGGGIMRTYGINYLDGGDLYTKNNIYMANATSYLNADPSGTGLYIGTMTPATYFYVNNAQIGYFNSAGLRVQSNTKTLTLTTTGNASCLGNFNANSLTVVGNASITGGVYSQATMCHPGINGAIWGNCFNTWWNGTLQCWIDVTLVGTFDITTSDRRLKQNITPARDVLSSLCNLLMIEFNWINHGVFVDDEIRHFGVFADDLQSEFPDLNIVKGEPDAITSEGTIQPQHITGKLTMLLLRSIQELNAKVQELTERMITLEKLIS